MSKRATEAASLELAFLAALDNIHPDVDTSEIAEIHDWSGAVRGKFVGASARDASELSKLKTGLPSASGYSNATNEQYSEMAIPQLIAVCLSESSEVVWSEFVRRFLPFITRIVTRALHRSGKFSHELVDDLSQEVLLKLCHDDFRVLRAVARDTENAFLGFLKVVAAHTAQDYFRKAASSTRSAGQALEIDHLSAPASSRGASSEPERKVLVEEIESILKTRAHGPNCERDYAIFWLYYRSGLTAKEIAALPGIKLGVKGIESVLLRLTREIKDALTRKDKKNIW
jgi:RNA polymerase sigma factor (sigma-70 family)